MSTFVFDIGGTTTRTAFLTNDGVGEVTRAPTPQKPEEAVAYLVAKADGAQRFVGCVAGIVDAEGNVVASTNLPLWNGFPLQNSLSIAGVLVNDAELAALGEAQYGAGKGYGRVAYIGLGTGVGTALIVNGLIQEHSSDGSARMSVIMLADGSTLEERVGGHSLMDEFHKPPHDLPESFWKEHTPLLVEAVGNAVALWSPDVVVLAGSLMNAPQGFDVADVLDVGVPVVRATLKDESALWGARALAG